ncbi:rhodanese-like domain-containing protein [Sodalis sp. dw_96]|uniref:rhodanese-like domain-containing protein n=1 Tax=Sodalis sp. dw_96 TaxID=2719794 RepID=UPI001BD432A4|nr:rhodanese-like domain-containing protein [Sodalis sp. dw_96]
MTRHSEYGSAIPLSDLLNWLEDGEELAFIDIREEGLYGDDHPLLAVNAPYSLMENQFPALVPRANTRTVLLAENTARGERAAGRLSVLGYSDIHVLDGGIGAWEQAGLPLFKGVNVPYKAFAELIEHFHHTPAIEPGELARLIEQQGDYVLLDSRTVEEYDRFHVPSAISVPSAELLYRFDDLVPSPDTLVVVSCAGRTRGIIGAQTLINAGVPNQVLALSGGTQGWRLADLATVQDGARYFQPQSEVAVQSARQRASGLAQRYEVQYIDGAILRQWQQDGNRTTYVFDVRNSDEYRRGHRADARWVPGGQLVQALDKWVGTRGGRIVLNDNDGVRATTTAHWLLQLGWQCYVLAGIDEGSRPPSHILPPPLVPRIDAAAARHRLENGTIGLSADRSWDYRRYHPAGTHWVNRSRLDNVPDLIGNAREILVFAEQPALAHGVVMDLIDAGFNATAVEGKRQDWLAAGLELHSSSQTPGDNLQIDFLFWLHDRHEGNAAASAAYLAWEADLPHQVGDPAKAHFKLGPADGDAGGPANIH